VGRLLRSLLARLFTRRASRGEAESLPADLRSVPFCHVPLALDGLPAARVQAENLKLAWGSGPLSPRARALVFAVVARGLGSELSEREAKRLLAREGLSESQVDDVLAHLASPQLDRIEAVIVPFARETIRIRPIEIQRRAAVLLEQLEVEEFIDLVGIVGAANATCRLSLFLCEA